MGLLGLPFAEDDGGVGAGPVEIGIVCQELGAVAAPEPYLGAVVVAGGLVAACGTAEQRQQVVGAAGRRRGAAGVRPRRARRPLDRRRRTSVTATQDGEAWTLTGTKEPVPHGARADVLVVSAALPDGGTGLFLVDPARRDGHRLPRLRRHPRRPRRPRRHRRDAARRARSRPDRRASRRCSTSPA